MIKYELEIQIQVIKFVTTILPHNYHIGILCDSFFVLAGPKSAS